MTLHDLENITQANDSNISFLGEKFFVAKKYNLKSKDLSNLDISLFYEDFLKTLLEYNYSLPYNCYITEQEDLEVIIDGVVYTVTRTERFVGRQGAWLKYKITDVLDDETLQTFYVLREANVASLCTLANGIVNGLIKRI